MNAREDVDGLGKPFAHRLSAMIEAHYLTYRELEPWADAVILRMDRPPVWILDLAVTKYSAAAAEHARRFAHSDPIEPLSNDEWVDDYVASTYLRYARRELSWATFLNEAGQAADATGGRNACEYFYLLLNAYEEDGFPEDLEHRQRAKVLAQYDDVVTSVRRVFDHIRASGRTG